MSVTLMNRCDGCGRPVNGRDLARHIIGQDLGYLCHVCSIAQDERDEETAALGLDDEEPLVAWRYDEQARQDVLDPDFRCVDDGRDHGADGMERIAADLNTGEEVPA